MSVEALDYVGSLFVALELMILGVIVFLADAHLFEAGRPGLEGDTLEKSF